jgi:hypothetical protein
MRFVTLKIKLLLEFSSAFPLSKPALATPIKTSLGLRACCQINFTPLHDGKPKSKQLFRPREQALVSNGMSGVVRASREEQKGEPVTVAPKLRGVRIASDMPLQTQLNLH